MQPLRKQLKKPLSKLQKLLEINCVHDSNFYAGLPAQLYDSFFSQLDEEELTFYAQHIKKHQAPALEIACGTGRILLPLLERGLQVEGFDASPQMLELCKEKAKQKGLKPILYQQLMQELDLPKKYGCLFSPLGSFQQIADRHDAQQALKKFYDHLIASGKLLIYLYVPWYNAPTFGQWHAHEPIIHEERKILVHEKTILDIPEQQVFASYRYEVWHNDQCIAHEQKDMTMRWYARYEFEMMLKAAGFDQIQVLSGYADEGPSDVMLFVAGKCK